MEYQRRGGNTGQTQQNKNTTEREEGTIFTNVGNLRVVASTALTAPKVMGEGFPAPLRMEHTWEHHGQEEWAQGAVMC